jgi:hypothetical protein
LLTYLKLGFADVLGLVAPVSLQLSAIFFVSAFEVSFRNGDIMALPIRSAFIFVLNNYFHALVRIEKEWLLSLPIQAEVMVNIKECLILVRL